MTTWFTADHHFNHANIIEYCNRPFYNVEQMNEELIIRWNNKVGVGDIIFHLGDFGFGNVRRIIDRLNGMIYLIPGSHDSLDGYYMHERLTIYSPLYELKKIYDCVTKRNIRLDHPITLCHYAMRTWSASHYNSWHLFGHSHGRLPPYGKSFDVGVDTHNFYLYSLDEIEKIMDKLPDNFNLVTGRKPVNNSSNYEARQMGITSAQ